MKQMEGALTLLRRASKSWAPVVLGASALHGDGVAELWAAVARCRDALVASGELDRKRTRQALAWTWHLIDAGLRERFRNDDEVRDAFPRVMRDVEAGTLTPTAAASQLLSMSTGG